MSDLPTLPPTFRKLQVKEKTTDIKAATELVTVETATLAAALQPSQLTVKVLYAGVNATDINSLLGTYSNNAPCPFDIGLEALGQVVRVGSGVGERGPKVGQHVLCVGLGSFAEYRNVEAKVCIPVPSADPKFLTFSISALTAGIAIAELGRPKKGQVAVVTAAAGGTGMFAVQYLKKVHGCEVVGTCSSEAKAEFLRSIGCDRVINYREQDLRKELKTHYPKGVNIVYESVGGDTFEACADNIAHFGQIILIGSITGYVNRTAFQRDEKAVPLQTTLMSKSASLHGFMLFHWNHVMPQYLKELFGYYADGSFVFQLDATPFVGMDSVCDAVLHLHSGKSFGKVLVNVAGDGAKL